MPLKFTISQKGKKILIHEGYAYILEKELSSLNPPKLIWRCVEYTSKKCRGRCHTWNDAIIYESQNHSHVADSAYAGAKEIMQNIKNAATTSMDNPQEIISSQTCSLPQATAGKLPSIPRIKRTIQRARQRENNCPASPHNLFELTIPDAYKQTAEGKPFLLFDSGPGVNRILLFSTAENLNILASSPFWYADGTFKTTPPLFAQVYTIHAMKCHNLIPVVYSLLPNKNQETYTRLFQALISLKPNLFPQSLMTDFEMAAINAFKTVFPDAYNHACFFHFCQNIYRQIQQNPELLASYNDFENPDFALHIRQLPALAYVPVSDVVQAFDILMDSEFFREHEEVLQPLLDYFEDNYIGRPIRGGGRRAPKFPHLLWSCNEAAIDCLPRTNNSVEAWHRAFNSLLSVKHPSIWKFIEGLRKEQTLNELKIEKIIAGESQPLQKKVYRDTAIRIESIVSEYGERNIIDFLRGIAHNFQLQV